MNLLNLMVKIGVSDEATSKIGAISKNITTSIGDAAKAGAKAMATAVTAVAAGTAKIGQAALEAYADYEQLAGGVKKLYGEEAYQQMMDYAQEAYRTVGVSANEYMQSVTSFSAAMLNSVGGDAEKAAALADQAMQDIADNANTFGVYTVEELTGVYQALAKGQYQTLDNLNLGYAGTKEGLQQLLNKAEELTGVHYDIENFADITEAIHVVQQDLNIAGTTANEAATTITGSLNMTKAAWKNLLIELGKDDGDVGTRLVELVNSATTFLMGAVDENGEVISKGVIGRFQSIAESVADTIPQAIPLVIEAGTRLFASLVDAVTKVGPPLAKTLYDALLNGVSVLRENAHVVLDAAGEMFWNAVSVIEETAPALFGALESLLGEIAFYIADHADEILLAAGKLFTMLVSGVVDITPKAVEALGEFIQRAVHAIAEAAPKLGEAASQFFYELFVGSDDAVRDVLNMFYELPAKIVAALGEVGKLLFDAGANIVQGLIDGINSKVREALDVIGDLTSGITDTAYSGFQEASPSKIFKGIGANVVEGFVIGVQDKTQSAIRQMNDFSNAMTASANVGAFANVGASANVATAPYGGAGVVNFEVNLNYSAGEDANELARDFARSVRPLMMARGIA